MAIQITTMQCVYYTGIYMYVLRDRELCELCTLGTSLHLHLYVYVRITYVTCMCV